MTNRYRNGYIDDLLVKYLLEETNNKEAREVEEWIQRSPENKQHYAHLKRIWEESAELFPDNISEQQAWDTFLDRIDAGKKQGHRIFRSWAVWAAALILLGISIFWLTRYGLDPRVHSLSAGEMTLTDTLPDHTIITLNKNSKLIYPSQLKGATRSVMLEGEAFFTVTHKEDLPFVVQVNDVTITDIGTEFNVKETPEDTEIIVATGSVQVSARGQKILLKENEAVRVSKVDGKMDKYKVKSPLYQYYQSREFICQNTPLSELVTTLSRAYDTRIEIVNPELNHLPITTTFHREQSLEAILSIIAKTFEQVSVRKQGETFILERP